MFLYSHHIIINVITFTIIIAIVITIAIIVIITITGSMNTNMTFSYYKELWLLFYERSNGYVG